MATPPRRRRSRSHIEDEATADTTRYRDRSLSRVSDGAAKRLCLRGGRGESLAKSEPDSGSDEDVFHSIVEDADNRRASTAKKASKQTPEFQTGAIVRVRVDNFVTYEHAEFLPGPNLNMVIGPNGTGKSSLVCAICLGLGYQTNVLGRATSFGDFVKHGKDHAVVEVELQKREKDKGNFVVRLRISREDNSRKFWINDKDSTIKGVQQLMRTLRIQIDNLCQFLPQDRVAEFAGLNSVDLLTKTLQAAAPPEMSEWQRELKELYGALKELKQLIDADAEQQRTLERRQEAQAPDVARLAEREAVEKMIKDLEIARFIAVYNEARHKYHAAKDRRNAAKEKLRRLERDHAPSMQAVNEKEKYERRLVTVVEDRKRSLTRAEDAADQLIEQLANIDQDLVQLDGTREVQRASHDKVRKEIGMIRQKITQLEARMKGGHKEFVAAEWNTKIREQEHLQREVEEKRRENQVEIERVKALGVQTKKALRKAGDELDALDSREGQRLSHLRRMNPDVAKGWEWLEEHRDDFEKEIFGPPMMVCVVKDNRYTDLIQSMLQTDDFFCFTAQCKEDHRKLSEQFYKKMGLSVTIRTCSATFDSFRPPLSGQGVAALGLDGFAIDYLEGPEPVLAMLCAERRLHASAVGLAETTDEQFDRIVGGDKLITWASGKLSYRITRRREYGPGAVSTSTKDVPKGRFWTDEPVATAEKRELQQKRDEISAHFKELLEENNTLRAAERGIAEDWNALDGKIRELKEAKNQLQKEHNLWMAMPDKIAREKTNLEQRREALTDSRREQLGLEDKQDDLTMDRAKAALRHKEKLSAIREAYFALVDIQVRLIEATSDVEGLKAKTTDITRMLAEEKETLAEAVREMNTTKAAATEAQETLLGLFAEESAERQTELQDLAKDKTEEDIRTDIEAEKSKLTFTHGIAPGVKREHENRAREIEKLVRKIGERKRQEEEVNGKIDVIREQWVPKLDELVGQINEAFSFNFQQISCAGEVDVHKDDDFDKWAIEIKVRFRENEALQRLDQHRQSGGERAVSTIFYLMSLQSMAQAPFRVVDEINQGMDPRNERMVHERMVEIACREHTSQYFLITPKLLPGLRYDERMRILCIASGAHMPSEGKKLDLRRCVRIQRRLLAGAAA